MIPSVDDGSEEVLAALAEQPGGNGMDDASSEVQFDDDLAATAAQGRDYQRQLSARRSRFVTLLAAGAAALLALAVVVPAVLTYTSRQQPAESPAANETAAVAGTGAAPIAQAPPAPAPPKPLPTAPAGTASTPVAAAAPAPPPPAPAGEVRIAKAQASIFASGGYMPSPPGMVYWRVSASISSGKPLMLQSAGPAVTLNVDGQDYPSLGIAPATAARPASAIARELSLEPGKPLEATFLFLAPAEAGGGALAVKGIGKTAFLVEQPPGGGDLSGTFAEAAPRNLRPMLPDPVMAAIQKAADQRLVIWQEGRQYRVSIPSAGINGTARRGEGDAFVAELSDAGNNRLNCQLRLLEGGKRLLLYLSPEPYHQITYTRKQ